MRLSHIARGAASAERGRRLMELRGVTPNGHPLWLGWEVQPLIELGEYRFIFPLLDRRTRPAVYSKASRLGATKRKRPLPWTDNEIVRLRKVYPRSTRDDILAAFPGRTYRAIASAAHKRKIRRAKAPLTPTGNRVLDQILVRARFCGYSAADLDSMLLTKGYFRRQKWKLSFDDVLHCKAVRALGGVVRAEFK